MPDTQRLMAALSDRYAIEREIGSGGMATVYLARDVKHDRDVALKVLRADLSAVLGAERFLKEIRISAKLDHPHILTLIDSGAADGVLYYVLPLVRGESLRAKLEREKQLPIEEAVGIIRQVASALDYAHKQGVVHRDIKPENILLHEGEAVVADFGIALALREAGGSRLTETGLSLGTPQYMSPEQATGDRTVDARSDVYSMGAVLYEMLAGEPPLTGPTVQAVIAKLLTERPTRLRTVRDTIPDPLDAAVAKALAKVPADRFRSAAEFAAALRTRGSAAALPAPRRRPALAWAGVAAGIVIVAAGAWALRAGLAGRPGPAVVVAGRTQLTFTGNVQAPALSADGKQLAFFSRTCAEGRCTYGIDVQDVGATATHRIFDGATAAYWLAWSPDRRNLLTEATIGGRWGIYLLSTLGGAARFLTTGAAAFYGGGDSLLVGPPFRPDSSFWIKVTSLDGAVADSIPVAEAGLGVGDILVVPGSRWIAVAIGHATSALWLVVDRRGRVVDRVINSCNCADGQASADALWMERLRPAGDRSLVRIAIDARTGRLARRQDTVLTGTITAFSVTADGSALAYDQGTYDYGVWALDLADALKGRFGETRRLVRGSTPVVAQVSPDGARLLVSRVLPSASGELERRLSLMPFAGGPEVPLATPGPPVADFWRDSVTVLVATGSRGQHVALLDIRTGTAVRTLELPDTNVVDLTTLPDGWAWIPGSDDRIIVRRAGRTIEVKKPAWFGVLFQVNADPAGRFIGMSGWNASTLDTLGVAVVSSSGGDPVMWATRFAENGGMVFHPDGGIAVQVYVSEESVALYRVTAPGRLQLLGTIPRPVSGLSASSDLKRVAVDTKDYHGDAWMSRVERR